MSGDSSLIQLIYSIRMAHRDAILTWADILSDMHSIIISKWAYLGGIANLSPGCDTQRTAIIEHSTAVTDASINQIWWKLIGLSKWHSFSLVKPQGFRAGHGNDNVSDDRDISTSALLFFYLQSWQAAFVILITIGSVSFFTYVGQDGLGANLNWSLISFVVLLPSILLLYMVRTALTSRSWSVNGRTQSVSILTEKSSSTNAHCRLRLVPECKVTDYAAQFDWGEWNA